MRTVLVILLVFILHPSTAKPIDSIGFEVRENGKFILHEVQQGQGLYSVSRRYNVPVDKIREANPEIEDGLTLGQIILVPYLKDTEDEKNTKPNELIPGLTHKVEAGETLYRISHFYDVTIEDLINWNQLENNIISDGQIIYISNPPASNKPNVKKEETQKIQEEKKRTIQSLPDYGKNEYRESLSSETNYKDITETGMGGWIDDRMLYSDRSLCLHPTAPVGSIIQVRNLMNDKIVYVKVVGRLNDSPDNHKLLIKLSGNAAEKLGVIDNFFRVELKYAVEE